MVLVFDSHGHIGESFMGKLTAEEWLVVMAQNGIAKSVISPIVGGGTAEGRGDIRLENDRISKAVKKYPDKFVGFGLIEPRHHEKAVTEVDRVLGELNFKGIAFHHTFSGAPADHPMMYPIMDKAAKYKVPVFVHATWNDMFESPTNIGKLAGRYPDVAIMVGHPFVGPNFAFVGPHNCVYDLIIEVAKKNENLFYDTSLCPFPSIIEGMVSELGADRVLFGTDTHLWFDLQLTFNAVRRAAISEEQREKILGGNVASLLRV